MMNTKHYMYNQLYFQDTDMSSEIAYFEKYGPFLSRRIGWGYRFTGHIVKKSFLLGITLCKTHCEHLVQYS